MLCEAFRIPDSDREGSDVNREDKTGIKFSSVKHT